jgi:hypothetical protein
MCAQRTTAVGHDGAQKQQRMAGNSHLHSVDCIHEGRVSPTLWYCAPAALSRVVYDDDRPITLSALAVAESTD